MQVRFEKHKIAKRCPAVFSFRTGKKNEAHVSGLVKQAKSSFGNRKEMNGSRKAAQNV